MRGVPRCPHRTALVAEYLADREGLNGAAREAFVRLLRDALGFKFERPRWLEIGVTVFVFVAAIFSVVAVFRSEWNGTAMLLWSGVILVGGTLLFGMSVVQRRTDAIDPEIEWRAYCLLLRPWILSKRAGLLDRNLPADRSAEEHVDVSTFQAFLTIALGEPADFWIPAAIGWGIGVIGTVIGSDSFEPGFWTFGIPILSAIAAPLSWYSLRLLAFRWMERMSSDKR